MADEIKVRAELSVVKGGTWDGLAIRDLLATMTGTNVLHNRQTVATTPGEALLLGDSGVGGLCLIINRDASNFVDVMAGSGLTPLIKINPLGCALFRISVEATAPWVRANTAAVEIEYLLLEA